MCWSTAIVLDALQIASESALCEETPFNHDCSASVLVPDSPVLLASMRVGRVSIRVSALTLYLMGPSYRSTFQDT